MLRCEDNVFLNVLVIILWLLLNLQDWPIYSAGLNLSIFFFMFAHTAHSVSWTFWMPVCFESFPSLLVLSVGIKGTDGRTWENCLSLKHTTFNSKRLKDHLLCNFFSLALKFYLYLQLSLYRTSVSTGAHEFQQRFRIKISDHTCSTGSTQAYHADHYLPLNRFCVVMSFYHWELKEYGSQVSSPYPKGKLFIHACGNKSSILALLF